MSSKQVTALNVFKQTKDEKIERIALTGDKRKCAIGFVARSPCFSEYDIKSKKVKSIKQQFSCDCRVKTVYKNKIFMAHSCLDMIQMYDTDTKEFFQFTQELGLVPDIRTMICNDNLLVGVGIKKVVLWPIQGKELGPSFSVMLNSSSAILTVNEFKSKLIDDTSLLIVNNNPGGHCFQLWKLPTINQFSLPELLCYGELSNKTDTINSFSHYGHYIISSTDTEIQIWDISKRDGLTPKNITLKSKTVATSIYCDEFYIIVGDNFGNVFVYDYNGYCLNSFMHSSSVTDINSVELNKLKALFQDKVNKITRLGRHILAAGNNGVFRIYDLFKLNSAPIEEIREPKFSFGNFICETNNNKTIIISNYSLPEGKLTKLDLCSIEPKTLISDINNPADIIDDVFKTLLKVSSEYALYETDRDIIERIDSGLQELKDEINIPFPVVQEFISVLDEYAIVLTNKTKAKSVNMEKLYSNLVHSFFVYQQVYQSIKDAYGFKVFKKRSTKTRKDEPIKNLLENILKSLELINFKFKGYIERFDSSCDAGVEEDSILPLLDIYIKLKQFVEDSKEIGKTIGTFNEDKPYSVWWEYGGRYDE